MRALAVLVLVAACSGGSGGECTQDSECGNRVCARSGECLPASEVRVVRVTWTIRGQTASSQTCGPTPDFYLSFASSQIADTVGYAPVPCNAGLFTVDKLPKRFISVEIGVEGGFAEEKLLDGQGMVAFDLAP